MQTQKDAQIVGWLGRIGAASAEHVMARFGMGRSWAYARLSRLVGDGLLEQRTLLYRQPGLYIATADGLRWTFLERLGVYKVGPGGVQHATELAAAAVALHGAFPGWELLSEREIRVTESDEGKLIASVSLGELPGGRSALHRPDLARITPDDRVLSIEIELVGQGSPAPAGDLPRLRPRPPCRPRLLPRDAAGGQAVARAVAETRSQGRITVLALDDVASLAAAEHQDALNAIH
jgi:hypothetical protein